MVVRGTAPSMANVQLAQHNSIEESEDACVGANGEREREDGNGREGGGSTKHPDGVPNVAHALIDGIARRMDGTLTSGDGRKAICRGGAVRRLHLLTHTGRE